MCGHRGALTKQQQQHRKCRGPFKGSRGPFKGPRVLLKDPGVLLKGPGVLLNESVGARGHRKVPGSLIEHLGRRSQASPTGPDIVVFGGSGRPRAAGDPLGSTGPAPHINLHKKSAPETNSKAISWLIQFAGRSN